MNDATYTDLPQERRDALRRPFENPESEARFHAIQSRLRESAAHDDATYAAHHILYLPLDED